VRQIQRKDLDAQCNLGPKGKAALVWCLRILLLRNSRVEVDSGTSR
jgi:hypothetical protein